MANFIPANTAYERSMASYEEQILKNKDELISLIDAATERGEFKVIYDRELNDVIMGWLNDYGYEVTDEGSFCVVSWENAGS